MRHGSNNHSVKSVGLSEISQAFNLHFTDEKHGNFSMRSSSINK